MRRRIRVGVAMVLVGAVAIGCVGGSRHDAPGSSGGLDASSPSPVTTDEGGALRYVALGDSYTIGTSESIDARWPNQLVARLGEQSAGNAAPPCLDLVANLGVNGYTSGDVIAAELPALPALRPEFLTLLIGVNDVVQGVSIDAYRRNVVTILDDLVERVGPGRVLVVTTPDYTVTPAGSDYGDPVLQARAIRAFNAVLSEVAASHGVEVVDIHDLSLRAANDRSLVASDGLHPSGAQYALWVERVLPAVLRLLRP